MELHKFERQLRLMMLLTQNRKYTLEELGKTVGYEFAKRLSIY